MPQVKQDTKNIPDFHPRCGVLSFLRKENPGDHSAQDAAEEEQRSQDREKFRDQGFAGFLLKYGGEDSIGSHIVEQEIGKDENRQCQNQ